MIRSANENGDGEPATFGDDKLYFYSNVRENEIRNFSLSLFQYFEYKFLMLDSVWYGDSIMSYLDDGDDFTVVHDPNDFWIFLWTVFENGNEKGNHILQR